MQRRRYMLSQSDIATVITRVLGDVADTPPPAEAPAKPTKVVASRKAAAKEPRAVRAERKLLADLGGFTYRHVEIPDLDVDPAKLDTQTSQRDRSPYNRLRFHLKEGEPLSYQTTFRQLVAEHHRLAKVVASMPKAKAKQAGSKTSKADPARPRKATAESADRQERINALVELGLSEQAATDIVDLNES